MEIYIIGVLFILCVTLSLILYRTRSRQKNSDSHTEDSADIPFAEALNHYIHNLKSPLSSVFLGMDNLKLMIEKGHARRDIFEILDEIRISVAEINNSVQELTLLTRQNRDCDAIVNVEHLISAVLESDETYKNIEIVSNKTPQQTSIDEQALNLILGKLLTISMKHLTSQDNLFIGYGADKDPQKRTPFNSYIKIFSQSDHLKKKRIQADMQEFSSDERTDLIFIKHFLFNNNAVLNGGITVDKEIYWEILFNGTGNKRDGKNSINRRP